MRFDIDGFVETCRKAVETDDSHLAVREIVARAVSDPASVISALGEPRTGGISALYRSDKLTILNIAWPPFMTVYPHNHNMWAVIGVYSGCEDNIFWRRNGEVVEAAGAKSLRVGDAAPLGRDIIHTVTNPLGRISSALQIYGGDFFAARRSEWDPETLREQPFDMERTGKSFRDASARFGLNG
jgi:predicted metal-dependent enzyme (double-stranded beta helix superfamily)